MLDLKAVQNRFPTSGRDDPETPFPPPRVLLEVAGCSNTSPSDASVCYTALKSFIARTTTHVLYDVTFVSLPSLSLTNTARATSLKRSFYVPRPAGARYAWAIVLHVDVGEISFRADGFSLSAKTVLMASSGPGFHVGFAMSTSAKLAARAIVDYTSSGIAGGLSVSSISNPESAGIVL